MMVKIMHVPADRSMIGNNSNEYAILSSALFNRRSRKNSIFIKGKIGLESVNKCLRGLNEKAPHSELSHSLTIVLLRD